MPLYDVLCGSCGKESERWAKVDERHVPCEGCGAATERIWRSNRNTRAADLTWPGGKTFENCDAVPRTFYSPKEYHAFLKSKGLAVKDDNDQPVASMSAHGLKQAEELMVRMYPDACRA
jgi:putative FmdB family regulatory protein